MKAELFDQSRQFGAGVTPCGSVEFVGALKPAGSLTGRNNQRAFCHSRQTRTESQAGLNGRCAIRKEQPASQQRVSPSGLKAFPPAGKSRLSLGKRFTGEQLWGVIRRASQSSLKAILLIIGYGALTEQARMTGGTTISSNTGYGSVAGITEQGITAQYMHIGTSP